LHNPIKLESSLTVGLLSRIFLISLRYRTDFIAHQLKRKSLAQQMIEKLFRFGSCFWFATQANPLFDRAINQLVLGHGCKNLIERGINCLLIDLLQPEVAFQSLSPDGSLLHAQRRVTLREPRIIQVAILAQAFDNSVNDLFSSAAAFPQAFSQFFDRSRFGRQQLARALEDAFAGSRWIDAGGKIQLRIWRCAWGPSSHEHNLAQE
jgi:hypothetical protein